MDTPATSRKRPASSASGASLCLALGPHPPPTMRSCFSDTGRGGVIAREFVASRIQAPLRFVLRLRLQKGGRICGTLRYVLYVYLRQGMGISFSSPYLKVTNTFVLPSWADDTLNYALIGASLSEPHTSVTALRKLCVCMYVCLRPYTVNFK